MGSRVCLALAAVLAAGCMIDLGSLTRIGPLEETVVLGESGPKILMLEIEGVISSGPRRGALGLEGPSLVGEIREELDNAKEDEDVAAVLLAVRSPGGTVEASETIYHEIQRWKRETGRPVVAYLQGLATSGGYYVAMAGDRVIAHPTAVTGSIGVIMQGVNLSGLMRRFDVENQTLTSGPYKDAGSALRPMREPERKQLQSVVDDLYRRFVEVVHEGRPTLAPPAIRALADGRVFTAAQALDNGLVDAVGHLDDAVHALEERAGLEESRLVVYHRSSAYRGSVYARAPSLPAIHVVDVDVFGLREALLPPGFYYLWPGP